ncbi:MAG: NAD-dependent epimerase/dehydratase family protein [bacterium]|nr:NAD-dependent epimerase/dehydratase family protein [bacterium]
MKILLLGGTGFLGSYVRKLLLKNNHDTWLLLKDGQRLEEFQHQGFHVLVGQAQENGSWIDTLPEQIDYIINLIEPELETIRLTVSQAEKNLSPFMLNIAKNLTYIASKKQVKRIFQSARILNYTYNPNVWHSENSSFEKSPTNWGKFYSDAILYLQNNKQTPTTLALFGSVIYDTEKTFAKKTIPYLFKNQHPVIGSGENWLQLTHVDDAASALVHLLEIETVLPVVNIVDDKPITQKDFFNLLAIHEHGPKPIAIPIFLGKLLFGDIVSNSLSDSCRAKNALLKSTNYWLKFPDYQSGFGKIPL